MPTIKSKNTLTEPSNEDLQQLTNDVARFLYTHEELFNKIFTTKTFEQYKEVSRTIDEIESGLRNMSNDLQEKVEELGKQITQMEKEREEEIKNLQKQIDSYESEVKELKSDIFEANKRVEVIEDELNSVLNERDELRSNLNALS